MSFFRTRSDADRDALACRRRLNRGDRHVTVSLGDRDIDQEVGGGLADRFAMGELHGCAGGVARRTGYITSRVFVPNPIAGTMCKLTGDVRERSVIWEIPKN